MTGNSPRSRRLLGLRCLWCLLFAIHPAVARAQEPDLEPLRSQLRDVGIAPTPEGIRKFLRALAPTSGHKKKVARLVQQLGSPRFQLRQQASRLLLNMPIPPVEELREAAEDRDLEISYRAREILKQIKKGDYESRLALAANYIRYERITGCTDLILAVAEGWRDPFVWRAFHRALSAVATKQDTASIKRAIAKGTSLQRRVAMGALPAIYDGEALLKRLTDLAGDQDDLVRLLAAEQLADSGDPKCLVVLFELLKKGCKDESRVREDLNGLIGFVQSPKRTTPEWLKFREQQPGPQPFRYPIDDSAVAYKVQEAGGRVGIFRQGEPLIWYSSAQLIPPGKLRIAGVELTKGAITPQLLATLRRTDGMRRVSLSGSEVTDQSLSQMRDLFQLTHLDLSGCQRITDGGMQSLSRLPALQELDLSSTSVSAIGLRHFAKHEFIRKLNLRRCRNIADDAMSTVTDLLALEELDLDETRVTGKGLLSLSKLDKLRSLSLGRQVDDAALVGARKLPLEQLKLNYSRVTATGMRHLASLKNLRELSFYRCGLVTDDSLASLSGLSKLEKLRLTVPRMTNAGLQHLVGLKQLKSLSLYDTRISGEGLEQLKELKQLAEVDLGRTPLSLEGLRQLGMLTGIKSLDLRTTSVTDEGVLRLRAILPNLERLSVESTRVTGGFFAQFQQLEKLRKLEMHNSRLTDAESVHLAKLKNLEVLDVSNTQISDEALKAIGKLRKLRELDISRTSITDAGLKHLAGMKSLRQLRLRLTAVTTNGANELVAKLPRLSWSR